MGHGSLSRSGVQSGTRSRPGGVPHRTSCLVWHTGGRANRVPGRGAAAGMPSRAAFPAGPCPAGAAHAPRCRLPEALLSSPGGPRAPSPPTMWRLAGVHAGLDRRCAGRRSQIANHLRLAHPADKEMRVSHETIYRAVYIQARGELRRELAACLRTGAREAARPGEARRTGGGWRAWCSSASGRPRSRTGRSPGTGRATSSSAGPGESAVATLVERTTRYTPARGAARRPVGARRSASISWTGSSPAARAAPPLADLGPRARRWPSTSGSRSTPGSRSVDLGVELRGRPADPPHIWGTARGSGVRGPRGTARVGGVEASELRGWRPEAPRPCRWPPRCRVAWSSGVGWPC